MNQVKNIVLVHGFWTDASIYNQIIPTLLAEGYEVMAVQNPLTSFADDVAATKRALNRIEGKCILVGHSWGGMVITEVGNDERVSGLVYIAALAPDVGESMMDLMSKYEPPSQYFQELEGFVWISQEGVSEILAHDLSPEECGLIYATQTPPSTSLLLAKVTVAAWRNKPSWYIIASNDKSVPPDLQRDLSKRIGATTMTIESSHLPMISHAAEVLDLIGEVAKNSAGYA